MVNELLDNLRKYSPDTAGVYAEVLANLYGTAMEKSKIPRHHPLPLQNESERASCECPGMMLSFQAQNIDKGFERLIRHFNEHFTTR
jgi:hypothetical protein